MNVNGTVRGGEHLVARFQAIGTGVRARMVDVLGKFGEMLEGYIQTDKLSGQVLNRRSGQLSNSINSRTEDGATRVTAVVGANMGKAKYAAAHEYGFKGRVTVPAHERMITMAFGKAITPTTVVVRAHSMQMNIPERSYLRSSLKDKGPEGVQSIREALLDLIKETEA